MIQIVRTNSGNKDFIALVKCLDEDLAIRDGDDHDFYAQFNKIAAINMVGVAYKDGIAVGCGALKIFDSKRMEIKRMYTIPIYRGQGIASKIIDELEIWASNLGFENCILETGKKQPEAIKLYTKKGYSTTSNYGQYKGVENSICFAKKLN